MRIVIARTSCFAGVVELRADVFELAGGGRLEGKLVESAEAEQVELRHRARRRRPAHDPALAGHARSIPRPTPKPNTKSWPARRPTRSRPTGNWPNGVASTNSPTERQRHLERILELDPNHEAARAALGFRQKDGQWMNRDDVMASRGLVHVRGPVRHAAARRDHASGRRKRESRRPIGRTRSSSCAAGSPAGARIGSAQAQAEIQAIHDPQAAEAIVATLRRENDPESQAAVDRSGVALGQPRRDRRAGGPVARRSGRRDSPPVPGISHQIRPPRPGDALHSRAEGQGQRNHQSGRQPRSAKSATATRSARSSMR